MPEVRIFAVAGNPVLHSLSPEIHEAGFRAAGYPGLYTRLAVSSPAEIFALADRIGIDGLNITSPFKESVLPFLAGLDPAARLLGAANTLLRRSGGWFGFNTDPQGAVGALEAGGWSPRGKRVAVLGAGGAGRAASFGLSRGGAEVTILNRTDGRAERAAKDIGCGRAPWEKRAGFIEAADAVVSCLPVRERTVDPGLLHRGQIVLDAVYPGSILAGDAAGRGCRVVPGEDWLLHQALPAFELFTGLPAPVEAMREALRLASAPVSKPGWALIGFMGAGKSAVGRLIARKTGRRFLDSDEEIEARTGRSVPGLFAESGEAGFRRVESRVLAELDLGGNVVAALGGGSVLEPGQGGRIRRQAVTFWLCPDPATSFRRIERGSRPLLGDGKTGGDAAALFRSRAAAYARTADAVLVNDDEGGPEGAAERIIDEIHRARKD